MPGEAQLIRHVDLAGREAEVKVKTARDVAKSLLVDVDAIICGEQRPEEDRHTAQASAAVLVVRLFGGICINIARIADALDKRDTDNGEES